MAWLGYLLDSFQLPTFQLFGIAPVLIQEPLCFIGSILLSCEKLRLSKAVGADSGGRLVFVSLLRNHVLLHPPELFILFLLSQLSLILLT